MLPPPPEDPPPDENPPDELPPEKPPPCQCLPIFVNIPVIQIMIPLNIPYIIACSILNAHPNIPPVITAIPAYNNLLFPILCKESYEHCYKCYYTW